MGGGEQMLLCKSLETGRITEYWENITQQHQWPHTRLASYPVPSLVVNELGTESKTTSSRLQESIKCVLNLMDTNPVGVTTNPDSPIYDSAFLGENGLDIASPDTILLQPSHKNRAAYHQKDRRTRTAQLESDRNLTNSLLSSTFREHRHTLCRLKETLTNYYLENCVQEIATVPSSSGVGTTTSNLHISGIAFTDTIPTSTTIATELGGLFVNDSIMANSLNQLQAATGAQQQLTYHWNFLFFVIIFIIAGGLGNILVCLAIALDRKLQNVTNYFLLSLAIADLLVSLFVMPLGAIPTFLGGHWPLGEHWCNVYVTCDVLACSASIWHMCFISLGRYLGIKNPLGSRHRATKRIVGIKIAVAWLMAMPVSSSIAILGNRVARIKTIGLQLLGSIDMQNIVPQPNVCTINNKQFFVYGSLVAFYIPMVIMVSTYALTVQLLRKKARFAAAHPEGEIFRSLMSHRIGGTPRYVKHSTGGCDGAEHVEVTNFKQPPPYFKSKVKSISETDLDDSPRVTISVERIENYNFDGNHQALTHSNNQASPLAWIRKNPPLPAPSNRHNGTNQAATVDKQQLNRTTQPVGVRLKGGVCSSISSGDGPGNNKKSIFSNTCDQATQTSPKPLKRAADMRGHKLKLNIQSVASPYLNFNLRLPKTRKKTSLSANAVANEQKATKVLGIVFFTFVLCWAPFFVLNIVLVIYPRDNIPDHVIDVCLWLGYVSSTINPIIYTIFNRTFRAAFIRLLRCNCQRSGRPYRYRSVTETKGAASLCARSALPLAISLQGTGFFGTSSTVSNTRNTSTTVTDSEC